MTDRIYHLAEPSDWAEATADYRAPSLEDEGFVHCSTAGQLADVARRHFPDRNDLILLTIDPEPLGESLVYEDLYELGEDFPHLYGPLPTSSVTATGPYLRHLDEGLFTRARSDPEWVQRVLHPEIAIVGLSGRTYTRSDVLDATGDFDADVPHRDYQLDLVDEDVAIARYVSRSPDKKAGSLAQRTSLWVNANEGWRIRFHQGLRGRVGNYVPPVLEALGLAEVEHNSRGNRMRAL